jgi:alpha-glucosidase
LIERDDQVSIKWVEKLAQDCASRGLLLVLHGCAKPTGLERMYPNIVNYEAVRGEECAKWDYTVNPNQRLYIPFIRMAAGPLDYTPGSMRNVNRSEFNPVPQGIPMTIGSRAHELALFVIFDQPLAFMSDSPTEYRKYPDIMKFLSAVPTTWDETLPLSAKVGEHAVMARRKGDEWYVGAISNEQARTVEIDFSFLPDGEPRTAEIYRDNEFTSVSAKLFDYETITVTNQTKLSVTLAVGGGAAVRVRNSVITGTSEALNGNVSVYQNENGTRLTIEADTKIESVVLIDMTGRIYSREITAIEAGINEMDISAIPKGLYIVRVNTRSKVHSIKIIH